MYIFGDEVFDPPRRVYAGNCDTRQFPNATGRRKTKRLYIAVLALGEVALDERRERD